MMTALQAFRRRSDGRSRPGPAAQPRRAGHPGQAAGGIIAAGAVALVSACGSSGSPAAAPTATVTTTVPASSSASAPAAASSPAASPSATAAPGCLTRYLSARAADPSGAAGSTYLHLIFTNLDNTTCTLYGYPGVSLAGGKPVTQIGRGAVENDTYPRGLVTLAPHGTAHAILRIADAANYPVSSCHPVAAKYLQVFAPNQSNALYAYYPTQACSKSVPQLSVAVVQPGS